MYFVYVLYLLKDEGIYIGQTENLIERYYAHLAMTFPAAYILRSFTNSRSLLWN